ncbi:MAG: PAS domain S-box protein [Desulfobacterales bacterium]|nr:PAS domain S-box protein [Desulfobacterales bacterium]
MEKTKILIVEDDGIAAMDIESRLKNLGYSVSGIVNYAEKAIEKVEELKPDLVLMDIVLKGEMDGIETAESIRSRFDIPVVFITTYDDEERFERAKLAIPFGFIFKPFQDRDLKITIEMALYVAKVDLERKQAEETLRESEERFKLLADATIEGIAFHDQGLLLDANDRFVEMFGYDSLTEMLDMKINVAELASPKKREIVRKHATEAYPEPYEAEGLRKDGSIFPVIIHGRQIPYEGRMIRIAAVRDITEQKKAEQKLTRLATAIEQAAESIIIADGPGTIQYINPAFERLSGYTRKEIVGQNFRILKSDKHNEAFYREMYDIISSGKIWSGRITNRMKDGTLREFETSIAPVHDSSGEIINFVSVNRNITQEVELESQLRQSQKLQSIGTLAGGIAHDFNNILFPIIGFVEMMLEDTSEDSPYQDPLNEVLIAAIRARDLVKQILAFSRQTDQELKPFQIQPIIKEVLKLTRSSLPSTINVKQNIKNDCRFIMADPTQIHQIAMNLITNAYHAMEDKGGELEVTLKEVKLGIEDLTDRSMAPGVYVCLTVADTGIGMDKSIIERIFDPYFTTKEKSKGSGMGLAVVHGIVKSHGGDIWVYSEPGQGTVLQVHFPVIKTEIDEKETEGPAHIPKGTERILLVDDEEQIIRMVQKMLVRLGYKVTARFSSLDALEAFRAQPHNFDLAISDLTMPNMTGDHLARELMNIRPDIPVILCTGFSERMSRVKADALGIKSFLMKPVVMVDLAKTLREVLDSTSISQPR